jgi:hypothetical protein
VPHTRLSRLRSPALIYVTKDAQVKEKTKTDVNAALPKELGNSELKDAFAQWRSRQKPPPTIAEQAKRWAELYGKRFLILPEALKANGSIYNTEDKGERLKAFAVFRAGVEIQDPEVKLLALDKIFAQHL